MNVLLWKKHATGIGWWKIELEDNWPYGAVITISHAVSETAAAITHEERIEQGKNIGRANETKPLEQAKLEVQSRIKKQLDKGYVTVKPLWSDAVTNQLGQLKPMLAQPLDKVVKQLQFDCAYAQPKLDGFRCLAHRGEGDQLIMYTRNGKEITTLPHIRDRLLQMMHPGDHFDGELYLHGTPLQTIASWVKRAQPESAQIEYHVYDKVQEEPFVLRQNVLKQRFEFIENSGNAFHEEHPNIVTMVETEAVVAMDRVLELFDHWRALGYEGAILRWGKAPYHDGKRSKHLVKIKKFADDEFEVVDIVPGKTISLNGNSVTPGIAVCKMLHGKQFRCPLPGDMQERQRTLEDKETYLGKQLTVKFANLTPDGIPFHPIGLRWRLEL